MPVEVSVRQRKRPIDREAVAQLASSVLTALRVPGRTETGVMLVSDRVMADLNRRAMGKHGTTDVLAFPIDGRPDRDDPAPYLGDVVISLDRAFAEGRARGHGPDEEFLTYLVHGILHLLGHDDIEPAARRRMERATAPLVARHRRLPTGISW